MYRICLVYAYVYVYKDIHIYVYVYVYIYMRVYDQEPEPEPYSNKMSEPEPSSNFRNPGTYTPDSQFSHDFCEMSRFPGRVGSLGRIWSYRFAFIFIAKFRSIFLSMCVYCVFFLFFCVSIRVVDPDPAGSEIICMFGSGSVI
jgi:hypothetical protein